MSNHRRQRFLDSIKGRFWAGEFDSLFYAYYIQCPGCHNDWFMEDPKIFESMEREHRWHNV